MVLDMVLMLGMMLMMISMMPETMMMTMVLIIIIIIPGIICPLKMSFFLSRFPPLSDGRTRETPIFLGFLDDEGYIGQRGEPGVAPGVQAATRRGLGWGRARGAPGHLVAPLWSPFCVSPSFFWKMASVDFQVIWRSSDLTTLHPLFTAESCVCCFGIGKL